MINAMHSLKAPRSLTTLMINPALQNARLIVDDDVSPFLGIACRISITCGLCDSRKYIEPVICKNKGNQMGHFAINSMFVLGCHEAGMSPVDADIICSSLSFLPLQSGFWSRKERFSQLEQRIGEAEIDVTEHSMREAMNEEA
jgi:hypothetical protein